MPRVVLVDGQQLFRDALRSLLMREADLSVVGDSSHGHAVYPLVSSTAPDVVIIEMATPEGAGVESTRQITLRVPSARVLGLASAPGAEHASRAFAAGAVGFALKSQGASEILGAIRDVAAGRRYVAPSLGRADKAVPSAKAGTPLASLSQREREVFHLIVRGLTNKEMATNLEVSIKTIETHRSNINRKLGLHSTAQLLRFAWQRGLAPVEVAPAM